MKPLLSGTCTRLSETIPILPSSVKSSFGIPCGHYLQAGTELSIEIRVAAPLLEQAKRNVKPNDRPFQLVCFLIERENTESCDFISDVKNYICEHNKKHFGCDDPSAILMTYQNEESNTEFESKNWFSGFHLYDKTTHAICVESSAVNVKQFVSDFVPRIYNSKTNLSERLCDVLFDSSLLFSKRVYSHNPILYTTKLHKSMAQILMNPKMYIEEHKDLVQGILTFWNLRTCRTLREAIRTESLPTKDQLLDLQKSMGVPIYSLEELFANLKCRIEKDSQHQEKTTENCNGDSKSKTEFPGSKNSKFLDHSWVTHKTRCWTPLDHSNRPFLRAKTMTNELLQKSIKKLEVIDKNKRAISNMSELVRHQNKKKLESERPYTQIFEELVMKQFLKLKSDIQKEDNRLKLEQIYGRESLVNLEYDRLKEMMAKVESAKNVGKRRGVEVDPVLNNLKSEKFEKSGKFEKSEKFEKSGKFEKSEKFEKSGKSEKIEKPAKMTKSRIKSGTKPSTKPVTKPRTKSETKSAIKKATSENTDKTETWAKFLQEYLSASEMDKTKFEQGNNRPPFRPFGHKTALESNQHVKKPSHDRVEKLHKPWIENTLHTATLEPTLPERDEIPEVNMRLYFGKMKVFDPNTPVSIFVGGDKQLEEMNRVKLREEKVWAQKLKGDERWKFYRQNMGTEQLVKLGPQFTMDKLKGILKDDPVLNNLKKFPVHEIPALPVFDK